MARPRGAAAEQGQGRGAIPATLPFLPAAGWAKLGERSKDMAAISKPTCSLPRPFSPCEGGPPRFTSRPVLELRGDAGAWSGGCVRLRPPIPRGKVYVFGEVAGFTGTPRIWVDGIGSEGRLYVQETRLDLWVKYLCLESPP